MIAALKGVVGGGLELAAATHVRVAEQSTFYALRRGGAASSSAAAGRCGSRG